MRLEVEDNGPRIAAGDQRRLFSRFSQIGCAFTRQAGGAGLGLSICKSLMDLMGGDIGVDSEAGKSATFWAVVPVKAVPRK